MVASREGHEDIVRLLLQKGAFVDARDGFRRSALLLQKSMSTWELLKFSWSMKGCLWAIVIRVNSQISGTIWLAYFLKSTIQTYCLGLGISGGCYQGLRNMIISLSILLHCYTQSKFMTRSYIVIFC